MIVKSLNPIENTTDQVENESIPDFLLTKVCMKHWTIGNNNSRTHYNVLYIFLSLKL